MRTARYKYLNEKNGATEVLDSGLRVIDVLDWYEVGETPQAIAEDFSIPVAAVFEALAYANEYPEEMQAFRDKGAAVYADWMSEWRERLGSRLDELLLDSALPR